ncbi:MAG: hypothetical protein NTZ18_05040 [Candidatus Komeilibacteria bacterium]|nr:hypothetical protein [Candidatus Komeilibacteria bacterium]
MQNIKVWLMDERYNYIERSEINFAPVIGALWSIGECEKKYPFLVGIDPYGDTYFNIHQAPKVIEELEELKKEVASESTQKEIVNTMEFFKKVEQGISVKFIGD